MVRRYFILCNGTYTCAISSVMSMDNGVEEKQHLKNVTYIYDLSLSSPP